MYMYMQIVPLILELHYCSLTLGMLRYRYKLNVIPVVVGAGGNPSDFLCITHLVLGHPTNM